VVLKVAEGWPRALKSRRDEQEHGQTDECHPSSPDVVAFEAIPSIVGKGEAQYPSAELGVINPFMEAHAEVYGGTYFREDHAYVGFVRDAADNLRELRALVPDPGYFIAYCAPFSIALQRYVSTASPVDPVLRAHGIHVLGSGLDPTGGGVEVRVAKITADTDSLLHQRYGDIVGAVDEGELQTIAG
jgi:hypothetical protein